MVGFPHIVFVFVSLGRNETGRDEFAGNPEILITRKLPQNEALLTQVDYPEFV